MIAVVMIELCIELPKYLECYENQVTNANFEARVNVKLVSEIGVEVISSVVVKGQADHVLISVIMEGLVP
ncbi:hypothetical protein CQW23_07411 [Capsicum baccatum]|uniref:Glutamate synthase domain-containing protein n=1 Tax=Capsicum baccatum TaxID=33114 RepID=A0A2G2X6B0_CAPBA|nr:hypothetical protein CQW23_07411 [Capsicum baccatum]